MRLLIIECGNSKLSVEISKFVQLIKPKPELVSTMTLNMERLNVPEFKHTLYQLAPDIIVFNPPTEPIGSQAWSNLIREIVRHTEVSSGKIVFVSSVDVLGDSYQRTEDAVEMPVDDYGNFLQCAETQIETTPRHFIIRLPYTTENKQVLSWVLPSINGEGATIMKDNQFFTLISIEEAAKEIAGRIQTGLYGKYHITPSDRIALSDLVEMEALKSRIPDRSLFSKYKWSVQPSVVTWSALAPAE